MENNARPRKWNFYEPFVSIPVVLVQPYLNTFKDEEKVTGKIFAADNPLVLQMFKEHAQYVTSLSLWIKNRIPVRYNHLQILSIIISALKKENFLCMLKNTYTGAIDEIYKELPHDSAL
jgi:hypothetical protein